MCKWPGTVSENKLILERSNICGTGDTEVFSLHMNIFIKKKKTFSEFRYFMEVGKLWDDGLKDAEKYRG